jgi:hypothetical protein
LEFEKKLSPFAGLVAFLALFDAFNLDALSLPFTNNIVSDRTFFLFETTWQNE